MKLSLRCGFNRFTPTYPSQHASPGTLWATSQYHQPPPENKCVQDHSANSLASSTSRRTCVHSRLPPWMERTRVVWAPVGGRKPITRPVVRRRHGRWRLVDGRAQRRTPPSICVSRSWAKMGVDSSQSNSMRLPMERSSQGFHFGRSPQNRKTEPHTRACHIHLTAPLERRHEPRLPSRPRGLHGPVSELLARAEKLLGRTASLRERCQAGSWCSGWVCEGPASAGKAL